MHTAEIVEREPEREGSLDGSSNVSYNAEHGGNNDFMNDAEIIHSRGQQHTPPSGGSKEISMPVGVSEEGQVIFAHVRFDAPLKKEFLESLRSLLQALEKGLA